MISTIMPITHNYYVRQNGLRYMVNTFKNIALCRQDDLPMFRRILDVLVASNFPLLAVELYFTERLASYLQSYCVKRTHNIDVLYMAHLVNRYPLEAHTYIGDRHCTKVTYL